MKKWIRFALMAMLFTTFVNAEGTRHLSEEEYNEYKEGLIQENEIHQQNLADIPEEEQPQADSDDEERISNASNPTTTHAGSYHYFLSIGPSGDVIEMDDQSVWSISSSDRQKSLDWLTSDILTIRPNHSWFSSYNYRIKNQSTGASVACNLSLNPILSNPHTHWITAIYGTRIVLEDGSIWSMSAWDDKIIRKWLVNDVVIIGSNDGWFRSSNPNILINTTLLPVTHARGACQN